MLLITHENVCMPTSRAYNVHYTAASVNTKREPRQYHLSQNLKKRYHQFLRRFVKIKICDHQSRMSGSVSLISHGSISYFKLLERHFLILARATFVTILHII